MSKILNTLTTQAVLQQAETIILKIGSVLITDEQRDMVHQTWLDSLAEDVRDLMRQGKKVAIVTSGGIALGRLAMGIPKDKRPTDIRLEHKQAASSIGQFTLLNGYHKAFHKLDIHIGQVLLTLSETENRRTHLNAREALSTLMERGAVPIINENDCVSTGEIRYGDNDRLAARVAQMIAADAIILLSTIDGLYTANPHTNPQARYIPDVKEITQEIIDMGAETKPGLSTGGMRSKIEAAQLANNAGIPLIIADGQKNYPISDIMSGTKKTTLFHAQDTTDNARQKWIKSHVRPKGDVMLDAGAVTALRGGKSLLPIGVIRIDGEFERGDAVNLVNSHGEKIGIGLSAYNSQDAARIMGQRSDEIAKILGYLGRDVLVHRNDMVLD